MRANFKNYLPIIMIGGLGACLLFGLFGVALSIEQDYKPLFFDAIIIVSLASAGIAVLLWLKSSKRSPLTRIQNGLAGAILALAGWIPPEILTIIPETEWPLLMALGGIAGLLLWLLLANIHGRMFHSGIAQNIAIAANIGDPNDPEVKRLSKNSILPNAVVFWTGLPSLIITEALYTSNIASSLSDEGIMAIAWGISLTMGLLAYNFLPAQNEIRAFIRESQDKHQC